jgi:hypothetical protein
MSKRLGLSVFASALAVVSVLSASAQGTKQDIALSAPATAQAAAQKNLLTLNSSMMPIYEADLRKFQDNFLKEHPIIVARFSGAGGKLTLYRPGQEPLVAPDPSIIYQMSKSVGHSAMITFDMAYARLENSDSDKVWKDQMKAFHSKIANALKTLDDADIPSSDKETFRSVLNVISDFQNKCLSQDKIVKADMNDYGLKIRPYLPKLINISAYAQAHSQMGTMAEWKKLLGKDWENTYAITNSMMVTRQNNLLYSMLAEFMGKDAINHRLYLFETTTFEDTDDHLINLLVRSISDNVMGETMLGNYWAMNTELLSNGGREIIIAEAKKLGLTDILPDIEPFNSTDWPWRHNPNSGSGPAELNQVK